MEGGEGEGERTISAIHELLKHREDEQIQKGFGPRL